MKRAILPLGLAFALAIAINASAGRPDQARHHIVATALPPTLTVDQLMEGATIIAIVEPTGNDYVHWNNAANTRWESDMPGRAMIYNDQEVRVVRVLKGTAPETLVIRNIGGVVGDTRYEVEDLESLSAGKQYVVLLAEYPTPTQEGVELAVSFVAQGQGIFEIGAARAVNALGAEFPLSGMSH